MVFNNFKILFLLKFSIFSIYGIIAQAASNDKSRFSDEDSCPIYLDEYNTLLQQRLIQSLPIYSILDAASVSDKVPVSKKAPETHNWGRRQAFTDPMRNEENERDN